MMLWTVAKCLILAVYGYFIYLFFQRLLGLKVNPKIASALIIIYEIGFDHLLLDGVLKVNYFISVSLSELGLILLISLLFRGSTVKKLALLTVLYLIRELTTYSIMPLLTRCGDLISLHFFKEELPIFIIAIIWSLSCIISCILLHEISIRCRNLRSNLPDRLSAVLLIPSAFILIILEFTLYACNKQQIFLTSYYIINMSGSPSILYQLADPSALFLLSILGLAADLIIVFGTDWVMQQILAKQQLTLQIDYYKSLEKQHMEMRSMKHDLKNHIISLTGLLSGNHIDSAKNYLSEILNKTNLPENQIKTGNYAADAILNEKMNEAEPHRIHFDCCVKFPELKITDFDLCVIMGNALDNAIEACNRMTSPSLHRFISVKSGIVKSYLILEFKNSIEDDNLKKSNTYTPGIGLGNIKAIVNKYDGIMDISIKPDMFILSLMLPV